jgi:CBS domain containing-hemolysin-like protein
MTGAWLETEEDVIESRAQLRNRMSSLLEEGEISGERHDEVLRALAAGTTGVQEIMIDTEDVVFLSTEETVEENLRRVSETPHTRYPLIGSDPGEVEGIVYVPSVVDRIEGLQAGETTFGEIAAPPMTVSPETSVSDAIDRFQAEGQELALVVSDGEIVGLVTATDAFEAVMGELEDPLDGEGQSTGGSIQVGQGEPT